MKKNILLMIALIIFFMSGFVFCVEPTDILTYDYEYFVPLGSDRTADYNKLKKRIMDLMTVK